MTERLDNSDVQVNPGYAAFQIAKALTTSEEHEDAATRERAKERVAKWERILVSILSGSVQYGSRTPVAEVPAWATLEVATGGFATGELVAAGPLQEHEKKLLDGLPRVRAGKERSALNAYFVSDAGLADLQQRLETKCYDVSVPEEGALLVVAWLVKNGYAEEARKLLDQISPYFSKLRFYPVPLDQPRRFGPRVHLQDVGGTIKDLQKIRPKPRILTQKEAVEVWTPFYDRMVALFLETVVDGWPCQHYPTAWPERARSLLREYYELRRKHSLCGKPDRLGTPFAQLKQSLLRCSSKPELLTGLEVGRIRLILNRYVTKRGAPDSVTCIEARRRQLAYVAGPTFHEIAQAVIPRLKQHRSNEGLDDVGQLQQPITQSEAAIFRMPENTAVPTSIQRKVERCLNETVDALVERDLITSGETLARVLPQMTSGIRAAGIRDEQLRHLYSAIYSAFRRRRSLLLFNLQKQVQIEELPWILAIERFRSVDLSSRELASQTLEEITVLTVRSFPHAILPNKLIQELFALVKASQLDIPLVEEVAADIFMGQFTGKYVESAKRAAAVLRGTLYETYYGIDYVQVSRLPLPKETEVRRWLWFKTSGRTDALAALCSSRAGVELGTWNPAMNGMIIEQQQILTTQNLAALFRTLNLVDALRDELGELARSCFKWICKRHQMKIDKRHAYLIMLKNTAYAWRQMIFFLSLLSPVEIEEFLAWAEQHLDEQREDFRTRFRPALNGLKFAAAGGSLDRSNNREVQRFLGWSHKGHWLM
ncbi:MAG TPA: hypothetical protein VF074_17955 [Pyrinomonadaceae bacterium]